MPAIAFSDTAVNLALQCSHLKTVNHAFAFQDNQYIMLKIVIYILNGANA